jgi:hypothetical protein
MARHVPRVNRELVLAYPDSRDFRRTGVQGQAVNAVVA